MSIMWSSPGSKEADHEAQAFDLGFCDRSGARRGPRPPDRALRRIDHGRPEHQPLNYTGSAVTPISYPVFGSWGFRFPGITDPASNPTLVPRTPINYTV